MHSCVYPGLAKTQGPCTVSLADVSPTSAVAAELSAARRPKPTVTVSGGPQDRETLNPRATMVTTPIPGSIPPFYLKQGYIGLRRFLLRNSNYEPSFLVATSLPKHYVGIFQTVYSTNNAQTGSSNYRTWCQPFFHLTCRLQAILVSGLAETDSRFRCVEFEGLLGWELRMVAGPLRHLCNVS